MNYPDQNGFSKDSGVDEAEKTLRLIASLPAPVGLEDRVRASLRTAPRSARIFAWPRPFSPAGGWLRGAAAAAIVCVVAGGGWGVYSRVQPGQPVQGGSVPGVGLPGGFSEGGAVRRPQTLVGPLVTPHLRAGRPKIESQEKPATAPTPNAKSIAIKKTTTPSAQPAVK